jgi:hypothetical protein
MVSDGFPEGTPSGQMVSGNFNGLTVNKKSRLPLTARWGAECYEVGIAVSEQPISNPFILC